MLILNEIELEANSEYLEKMRSNEILVINGLISSMIEEVKVESVTLTNWLAEEKLQMSEFASSKLKESLTGGFSGKAATAAVDYLTDIPQPNLQSPII